MTTTEPVMATVHAPGAFDATGVVQGEAIGAPLIRQPSNRPGSAPQPVITSTSTGVIASSVLYSPLLSKMFARYDIDSSGGIDPTELCAALNSLGLSRDDVSLAMKRLDSNGDGLIQAGEWEANLDERLRSAIDRKLSEEATGLPSWLVTWLPNCCLKI